MNPNLYYLFQLFWLLLGLGWSMTSAIWCIQGLHNRPRGPKALWIGAYTATLVLCVLVGMKCFGLLVYHVVIKNFL